MRFTNNVIESFLKKNEGMKKSIYCRSNNQMWEANYTIKDRKLFSQIDSEEKECNEEQTIDFIGKHYLYQ